jgi:putative acetyltransferase
MRIEVAADLDEVRALFREYADSLGVDLGFQDFAHELETLGTFYDVILVAMECGGLPPLSAPQGGGKPPHSIAGCVALRDLGDGLCEMKRLYVRPAFRGRNLGRTLALHVIEEARARGYRAMRLDTLPSMQSAMALYESLGFRDIEPYRFNPIGGSRFMELKLRA